MKINTSNLDRNTAKAVQELVKEINKLQNKNNKEIDYSEIVIPGQAKECKVKAGSSLIGRFNLNGWTGNVTGDVTGDVSGNADTVDGYEGTDLLRTYNSSVKTVSSANYTILDDDTYSHILVTTGASDRTITLPTASDNTDRIIKIQKVDSGTGEVLVSPEGSETLNGLAFDWRITEQYDYVQLISDGSNWLVIDNKIGTVVEFTTTSTISVDGSANWTENQWQGITSVALTLTPGIWEFEYMAMARADTSGNTTQGGVYTGIDTSVRTNYSGNLIQDSEIGTYLYDATSNNKIARFGAYCKFEVSISSNTTYYLHLKPLFDSSADYLRIFSGHAGMTKLKAKRIA